MSGSEKLQFALDAFPDAYEKQFKHELSSTTLISTLEELLKKKQEQAIKQVFETMSPNDIQLTINMVRDKKIDGLNYPPDIRHNDFTMYKTAMDIIEKKPSIPNKEQESKSFNPFKSKK